MTAAMRTELDPDAATSAEAEQAVARAVDVFTALRALEPSGRARLLRAVSRELATAENELVALAEQECRLPAMRLRGELVRTTFQLDFFAGVLDAGEYLRATIDHSDPQWRPGARPDLRRMMQPLGPIEVFAAGNFPFAFSTVGGDTASALAAGCPVIVKVHPDHPRLSARTLELARYAAEAAGCPPDVLQAVFGEAAGRQVLLDPRLRAGSFTGSLSGGRFLSDLAAARPEPIPFYAEMGSLNPVFVTESAARDRGDEVIRGFTESYTLGAGQFCTKPGLLIAPQSLDLVGLAEQVRALPAVPMLSDRTAQLYRAGLAARKSLPGVRVLVNGSDAGGREVAPSLLQVDAATLRNDPHQLLEECFGPVSVVAAYERPEQLLELAGSLRGQLTATVHATDDDDAVRELLPVLAECAGRVIFGGWPTGVAVSWAMQHGGPYPATTCPLHTSVGSAAIDRFLRPVTFQSVPDALLPPALRDANPLGIPRLVDGVLRSGAPISVETEE